MAKVYNAMLKPISPRRDVATLVFEKRDRHRWQPAVASPVDSKTRKTFLYAGLNTGSSSDGSYRGLSGPCTVYELAKIDTYRGYYSPELLASIVSYSFDFFRILRRKEKRYVGERYKEKTKRLTLETFFLV